MTLNSDLFDEVVRRAILLERYKNGRVRDAMQVLDKETFPEIARTLEEKLGTIKSRGYGNARPKKAQEAIDLAATNFNGKLKEIRDELRQELIDLARRDSSWLLKTLRTLSPLELDFNLPSPNLLRAVVSLPIDGFTYVEHWDRIAGAHTNTLRQAVTRTLAQGGTIGDITSQVRASWDTTRRQVDTVVRTTITHVSAQARATTAIENSDFLKGERWVATLDDRTSLICASLDGQVFPVGEGRRPPAHFNCRSTMVPVVKSWRELGYDRDELPASTRASMNGQVPAAVTYPDWLRDQPKAVQDSVLGRKRAELWRSGEVSFTKFVNDTGSVVRIDKL